MVRRLPQLSLISLIALICGVGGGVVTAIGCGSRQLGSDEGASTTDPSSSESSSSAETDDPDPETGSEESTTETETETETGVDFVPETEFPVPSECDPFAQDCLAGEKCVPYSFSGGGGFDANKCVPILGDGQPGEPCSYGGTTEATDDCGATSYCWNVEDVDGEQVGTCYEFCSGTGDDPTCPEGFICPITGDGTLTLCHPLCDPLAQDCDEGLACYWVGYVFLCSPETQNHPTGEPCGYVNDCAPGNVCVDAMTLPSCEGAACCTRFCDLGLPDDCDALLPGTSCVAFFEVPTPPHDDVGVCLLP